MSHIPYCFYARRQIDRTLLDTLLSGVSLVFLLTSVVASLLFRLSQVKKTYKITSENGTAPGINVISVPEDKEYFSPPQYLFDPKRQILSHCCFMNFSHSCSREFYYFFCRGHSFLLFCMYCVFLWHLNLFQIFLIGVMFLAAKNSTGNSFFLVKFYWIYKVPVHKQLGTKGGYLVHTSHEEISHLGCFVDK